MRVDSGVEALLPNPFLLLAIFGDAGKYYFFSRLAAVGTVGGCEKESSVLAHDFDGTQAVRMARNVYQLDAPVAEQIVALFEWPFASVTGKKRQINIFPPSFLESDNVDQ